MEALLFLPCVLSDDTQAGWTRKYLMATRLNRKPGGFTDPQVCGVVGAVLCLCCSYIFNTSTSPSCPETVLTERKQNVNSF